METKKMAPIVLDAGRIIVLRPSSSAALSLSLSASLGHLSVLTFSFQQKRAPSDQYRCYLLTSEPSALELGL